MSEVADQRVGVDYFKDTNGSLLSAHECYHMSLKDSNQRSNEIDLRNKHCIILITQLKFIHLDWVIT